MLLLNIILIHSEDSELLYDLGNLKFHVHRVLSNVIDDVEQVLDRVDCLYITLKLLLVFFGLTDD